MKKLVLFLTLVSLSWAIEMDFKEAKLNNFELQGYKSNIIYKDKEERNEKIAKLWEKFLTSSFSILNKSIDGELYVIYSDYKKNAFNCFIGIKLKEKVKKFETKMIKKSAYQQTILKYKTGMKLDSVWDKIQKLKIKRNFKTDIERHKIDDILKDKYNINIYLSSK